MGGAMSRNKGKRGERGVIDLLQPVVTEVYALFEKDAPKLKRNTLQSDGSGSDIAGLPWAAIEVKNQEVLQLERWWQQTLEQAGYDKEPILFYKRNHIDWNVRMFGMLGMPSCSFTVPVIVKVPDFLAWFRLRLTQELQNEV